jgi:two-component system, cell cycle sensor histidine kinase and response regulator CckA
VSIRLTVRAASLAEIQTPNRFPIGWSPLERAYACIEVSDTGCGIEDSDSAQIFDPFFSKKFPGRGLGLAFELGIVQAHQGAIAVKSSPGQGSVIRIFIPLLHF